jgi:hypothetical protein
MAALIWFRIPNAVPGSKGIKRLHPKGIQLGIKRILKKQCNWYKILNVTLFSLKVDF